MVFLTFLTRLLQRLLKLINFLGELGKVLVSGITSLSAFLSGTETGFFCSVLLVLTTLTGIVGRVCAPMLLA